MASPGRLVLSYSIARRSLALVSRSVTLLRRDQSRHFTASSCRQESQRSPIRYLIVDGYSKQGREELRAGGASPAGELYDRMLRKLTKRPAICDIVFPSDEDYTQPELSNYDAVAWTGCSLCIYDNSDTRVTKQIAFAKDVFQHGLPQFGSCWALQIAIVAAGGVCAKNPKGREMGIARKIALTPDGRSHPMFYGRTSVFDAYISHEDEVTHAPTGTLILAGNPWTVIQAASIRYLNGEFWAVQYHPEYDLRELARLTYCRKEKLTKMGFFSSVEEAEKYVEDLETLYENPTRRDLAWKYGIDEDVLLDSVRENEVENWIKFQVLPYHSSNI